VSNLLRFLLAILSMTAGVCQAQSYPTKPISLVIGFPPGGGADGVARPMAEALGKVLGQPVILDYRPGAGTTIASALVASSPADGYTLYMSHGAHYGADKVLYKDKVKYAEESFTPIALWTRTPFILAVNTSEGIASTQDLIERARANPGKLFYSSSGIGVGPHLAAVLFEKGADVKMSHVPFKGGAAAGVSLASGEVNLTFATPPSILPVTQTGKVKAIAVTSGERSRMFPDLPTISEAGVKGYDYTYWFGLFGPANLPQDIVAKLADANAKVLSDPDLKGRLSQSGNEISGSMSPAEFTSWAQAAGRVLRELTERSGAMVE
jgi:tripartite-type tricarboxylate transporter receptor subunit TctC